jgi:surface protein
MGYGVLDFRRRRASGFGGVTTDFVMTAATTGSDETFTIPCQNVGTFDATVDWGDGSTSAITAYNDADLAHTYATAGDYQIKISGTFPNIYFNNVGDKLKVKSVENLGVLGWLDFAEAFYGCANMTSFVAGNTNTSSVTGTSSMFYDCTLLATLDLAGFNTSSVTNMSAMFRDCNSLTSLDLTSFDTSSVTNMSNAFRSCIGLTTVDMSSFDTSSVTNMRLMFHICSSLTDITGVENFDIEGLNNTNSLDSFMTNGATLSTARYDALLANWDAQNPFDGMSPDFGNSTYTAGGAAAAARANLISTDGWTITDGGTA